MASLPPHQAPQRRSTSEQTPTPSSSQRHRSESRPGSTISEDSQTLLLNNPTTSETVKPEKPAESSKNPQNDSDVKKCWICFADETEDTPETSGWRDPCPCALVAHEDCLLDWIADMEGPSSRKRTLGPPKLLCPQCKSEIHLARPRDPLVEIVKAGDRIASKVVTPAAVMVALSAVKHACTLHGIHTVYAVFGYADGWRIMRPALVSSRWFGFNSVQDIFTDFIKHWRLHLGLPLITPMLVFSRTTLADSVLPVLPIVFFATQGDSDQPFEFGHYPPSASLAMAVLPYVRGMYNAYYERVWAAHEKRWIKEMQPRNGQTSQNGNNDEENAGDAERGEEEGIFEIRVDGNIWDDWDIEEVAEEENQLNAQQNAVQQLDAERQRIRGVNPHEGFGEQNAQPDPPNNQAGQAENAPLPQAADQNQQQQNRPQVGHQHERRLSITTAGLAQKILGALMFPTIAGLSGEALRWILPASWTTKPYGRLAGRGKATGLLQERWGRSIIGGCLFVVVKDAVMLYVRWKMAQQHRRRRVLDYDRKKQKVVGR